MKFEGPCSTAVFYGLHFMPHAVGLYFHAIEDWLTEIGMSPTHLAAQGEGLSGKSGALRRMRPKVLREGLAKANSLYFYTVKEDGLSPTVHWIAMSAIHLDRNLDFLELSVRSDVQGLDKGLLSKITRVLVSQFAPDYGFGLTLPRSSGPDYYAIGLGYGASPDPALNMAAYRALQQDSEERYRWSCRGVKEKRYLNGMIRDVYEWNFLRDVHLRWSIAGVPLRQWIQQDASRGTLLKETDDIWLWEVEESRLPPLRAAVREAGMVPV